MGQHGRNHTGSDATRGDHAFETERHDLPIGDDEQVEGYAPAFAGPWDPHARPRPGIEGTPGPMPVAGAPDPTPRAGFDGPDRRRRQTPGWEENDRRRHAYTYAAPQI